MMSGRLVKAVAASVVPLALLQGCGEKGEVADTPTPTPQAKPDDGTPQAPELATDISSLVENEFKNRERKNVKEFLAEVLDSKIEIVDGGAIAQSLPTKITLNVLAHHHDGSAGDFHAVEDMYSIKELRGVWEYKEKQLEMPAPSITQGFRESFVVNKGDIYLASPINAADKKAAAGVFFSYDGEAPVKGEDGNSRKTFGDAERREEDKVSPPMVIISTQESSAYNMLYNYGLAVITVRDLGMSTCFKAAFDTFKIVTLVIAEARSREAKKLSYEEENFNNFNLWKKTGDGADESYNAWALYTKTDDTAPKGQKEPKCGAKVREYAEGKREAHLKETFDSFYKNVRLAQKRFNEIKTASSTQMSKGNLTYETIPLCNPEDKDRKKYNEYMGRDAEASIPADESWKARTVDDEGNPLTAEELADLAGGVAKIFDSPKALYWKLSAYARNAVVYHKVRNDPWFQQNLQTRKQPNQRAVSPDLRVLLQGEDINADDLAKNEPLGRAEDFKKDLNWMLAGMLEDSDIKTSAFPSITLDVAMHHDPKLFKLMDDVAEDFQEIYSLSDPAEFKEIPMQKLFAPFFCYAGTGLENIDRKQPEGVTEVNKVWSQSFPKDFPMTQKEVRDAFESFLPKDGDHPAQKACKTDHVQPYKSRLPEFLFDIISGKDEAKIEVKFPYFTHKDYDQKQKDLGFKVDLICANRKTIYTTVPESIYWSAPAKSENVAVAMFLGMTKALYQEYSESDKFHTFFLGKGSDKSKNSNDMHQQRKFMSKDKDNKNNIPMEIILANKEGGADWKKVKEAAAAAIASSEDSA